MSEQNTGVTTTTEETNNEQVKPAEKEFEAITSQDDFDKAIQARIARERAKFADYDEVKARADKLAEIEESQKTEAQKQREALEQAQKELTEVTAAKTRAEVAAEKGVPAGLLSGSTREDLEASADALIEFRGEQLQAPAMQPVPTEGTNLGNPGKSQLNDSDIESMSPEDINKARREGRLNKLLGIN